MTRGVSEVISTIMLNVIGGGIVAYLLDPSRLGTIAGSQQRDHQADAVGRPPAGHPGLRTSEIYGFIVVAIAWSASRTGSLLGRTRFGFDLRATGLSETAAVASGVNVSGW